MNILIDVQPGKGIEIIHQEFMICESVWYEPSMRESALAHTREKMLGNLLHSEILKKLDVTSVEGTNTVTVSYKRYLVTEEAWREQLAKSYEAGRRAYGFEYALQSKQTSELERRLWETEKKLKKAEEDVQRLKERLSCENPEKPSSP